MKTRFIIPQDDLDLCKHALIVTVPIALESLFRVVFFLEAKEFRKLWVATQHLLTGSVFMIGQIVAASTMNRHFNETAECLC